MLDVKVSMVRVAEKTEHFDVGETLIDEPFVEMMDLASRGRCPAVGIDAVPVPNLDRQPLRSSRVAFRSSELQDLATSVLEEVVQIGPSGIEQVWRDRDRTPAQDLRLVSINIEDDHNGGFGRCASHRS